MAFCSSVWPNLVTAANPLSVGALFESFLATPIEEVVFYGGSASQRFGVHGDTVVKAWKLWQQFLSLGALQAGIVRTQSTSAYGDLKFRVQQNCFTMHDGSERTLFLREEATDTFSPEQWDHETTLIWMPGCESSQLDEQLLHNGKMAELQRFWQRGGNGVLICGSAYAFSQERRYRFDPNSDELTVKSCPTPLYRGVCQGPAFPMHYPADPQGQGLGTSKLLSSYMHAAPTITWQLHDSDVARRLQGLVGGGGYFELPAAPDPTSAVKVVARYNDDPAKDKIASLISSYRDPLSGQVTGSFFCSHIHAAYDDGDVDPAALRELFPDNPTDWATIKTRLSGNLDERLLYTFSPIVELYRLRGSTLKV